MLESARENVFILIFYIFFISPSSAGDGVYMPFYTDSATVPLKLLKTYHMIFKKFLNEGEMHDL